MRRGGLGRWWRNLFCATAAPTTLLVREPILGIPAMASSFPLLGWSLLLLLLLLC